MKMKMNGIGSDPEHVSLSVSFADAALETNVEIREPDEFIVGRKYVCAVAARGLSQFIQSAGTASEPIDEPDHNRIKVRICI